MTESSNCYLDVFGRGRWQLTTEQYNKIEAISENMGILLNEIDQYTLMRYNLNETIQYFDYASKNRESDFINLNRYFTNFLNSYYMWIEYHEKNYTDLFDSLKPSFLIIIYHTD